MTIRESRKHQCLRDFCRSVEMSEKQKIDCMAAEAGVSGNKK